MRKWSGVVGSMNPRVERPGAIASGKRFDPTASSRTIGADESAKLTLFLASHRTIGPNYIEISRHQREGLRIASLRPAQSRDRIRIRGIASELIAAESLDRDDLSHLDQAAYCIDTVAHQMLT